MGPAGTYRLPAPAGPVADDGFALPVRSHHPAAQVRQHKVARQSVDARDKLVPTLAHDLALTTRIVVGRERLNKLPVDVREPLREARMRPVVARNQTLGQAGAQQLLAQRPERTRPFVALQPALALFPREDQAAVAFDLILSDQLRRRPIGTGHGEKDRKSVG